ncbi:phage tail tip fiber protein [Ponticoccus litoralis]|uniref:DUF1983 domain-containing protein n=1 Tax=Ponticoccus litoralis TaxID=422297 RepID=A0AAW9SU67_9RHOB
MTWQLRVAATGEVIPQGLFADASERVITLADGVLPDVDYEIRASFVTGAPDLRSWSAWLPVTTPDLRLSTADFADDIRDSVTTLNQWITDGVTDLGGDLAALEDGLTAEAAARAQAIADEAAQRIADAAALADRWRGLRDAVHDLQSEVVELAAGDHAAREEIRRTLTATLEDARAFFEEQIVTLADEDLAAVLRIVGLEAETGALSASITSIDQARVDGDNALAATIAALSVGSATQFDAAEIWHFDADTEGWTGGAWQAGGFLRATDTLHSPTGLAFDAARYSQLRMRLVRTGTPTWTGTLEWNAASGWDSVSIPEPTWTDDVALVTVTVPWTGTVDQIRLDLVTGTVDVDWIAMGRPAPGASSADLDALRQVISDGDNANASDIVALEARMTDAEGEASGLASAVGGLDARVGVTEDGVLSNSNAVSALQSKVDDPTTGLGALADALDVLSTTVATGDGSQRVQSEAIRSVRAALSLLEAEATEAAVREEEARRSLRDYTASAEQSLNTRIDATDGQVAVVAEAVALLGVEVEGKASASVLDSLTATVTQRGEDITANTDAINLINAALPGKASTSALAALSGTVSQQGEDIAANSNAITAINAALPGKASAAALTALSGTVTQQGEDITANTDAINLINAALPGKASTSALAALSGTVSQQGEDIAANSNAITAINAALADKASAAALTSLSGTVSQQGDDITANAEALVATSAAVGRVSANGYFRVTNNVDQHGALSRIGLLATILDDGTSDEAAIYLEARTGEPNRVVVDAERFAIADNNGANVAVPFVVDGGKVYMDYAFIRDLSATAATIGTFRTSPAGERTEISDNGVVVYDNAGNVRVKLGDLS